MKLTDAQYEKLAWLHKQGGSGYLDKHGRVVAGGEHMPQGCWPAWLNLIAHGLIAGGDGRLAVTDYGRRHVTPNVQVQRDSGSIIDGGSAGTTGSAPDTNKERQAMSIDIVKRLRYAEYNDARLTEAAEEIERLREGLKIASAAVENLEHEVAVQRKAANEHRNAAMEADQRTQAAVRGEKQARASVERLHVKAGPLLDALDADTGGGLPDVDAWVNAAEAVLRDVMKTPNADLRGRPLADGPA